MTALQPRVSWDRVHNRVLALPGSQQLALTSGGTIPDTGQYAVLGPNGVRLGELDEEFIYERRVGDVFLLGTTPWRLQRIDADRVIVMPTEGDAAMVPFWRGESTGRSHELGRALGGFLRELSERIDAKDTLEWLQSACSLDPPAARNLVSYVRRQLASAECVPSDRTVLVEASRDQLGDWQVLLLTPRSRKFHLTLRLIVESRLRQRLGYSPQCLHHDDGFLIRLIDSDEPVLDLLDGLTPENVEEVVLNELGDSALFALRFRQNAARALLMPRAQPGRRAPLWLQRLRGRDLLQVARRHPDFPIVAETFRECLHDHLDVPRVKEFLTDVREGRVEVRTRRAETPSPFASGLLFNFTAAFMYQYDGVEKDDGRSPELDLQLLQQLVSPDRQAHLIDPRAVHQVERRLRGLGQPPRSATEMAEWLRRLGDLTEEELEGPMAAFAQELQADGRAVRIELPGANWRWVLAEEADLYREAFADGVEPGLARRAAEVILSRFLDTHALVGLDDVLRRYPFDREWAERQLREWGRSGRLVEVRTTEAEPLQWSAPANLDQVQRGSLGLLRREVTPCPPTQFVDFVLRWQGVHPSTRRGTSDGVGEALHRLEGVPLPAEAWEKVVLPARVPGYQPRWLDERIAGGEWVWVAQSDGDSGAGLVAFLRRESLLSLSPPPAEVAHGPAESVLEALRRRGASFVIDIAQETGLPPSGVRSALWSLLRGRLVTNDHFDVVRKGAEPNGAAVVEPGRRLGLKLPRRPSTDRPEGRWSLVSWGRPEPETQAIFHAALLLQWYGVAARELAQMNPWLLPWRVLYEVLSRMELAGEVRRGYYVEGLTGAQFALPEAGRELQELTLPSTSAAPAVLLQSLDPANLYGSGAPLDVPLLDGGTRSFTRRPGNWLVVRGGRPVLLVEQQGKKLTALASSSRDDVTAAVACLPGILDADRSLGLRHKLTVEEWNGRPVTATEGKDLLESAGFVRDYQVMTLYAAWR